MRESVSVISSFNKVGEAKPLFVQLSKGDKTIDLKVTEYTKSEGVTSRCSSYRCRSAYRGREVEYALDFFKGTTVWYITISNSTYEGLFK